MGNNNVHVNIWWVALSQRLSFLQVCWISSCLLCSENLNCAVAWAFTVIENKPIKLKFLDRLRRIQKMYTEIGGRNPLWSSVNNFLNEFLAANGSESQRETSSLQILTLWSKGKGREVRLKLVDSGQITHNSYPFWREKHFSEFSNSQTRMHLVFTDVYSGRRRLHVRMGTDFHFF